MTSGVYIIRSKTFPDRLYVGATKRLNSRWYSHKNDLIHFKHGSTKLQDHANEFGIDDLIFKIIEYCEPYMLEEREQYWITELVPYFNTQLVVTDHAIKGRLRQEVPWRYVKEGRINYNIEDILNYCDRNIWPEEIIQIERLNDVI